MAAPFPSLFSEIRVGPLLLRNRCVVAPMERNYAHEDGTVTDRMLAHFEAIAAGKPGWLNLEAAFIDAGGRGRSHQLGIHGDHCIPGLTNLVSAIHGHGSRVGIQLHHAGRNTSVAMVGRPPVAPSRVACLPAGGDVPHSLTQDEIHKIIDRYQAAAQRAVECDADAIELHAGHGYLPMAFLSPLTNRRRDRYGGSRANRARFALEVLTAIKNVVPSRVAVGCRISIDEFRDGGLVVEDALAFACEAAELGLHYLHVSAGCYESRQYMIPPMDIRPGWLLPQARLVREATGLPVVGVSRIDSPALADAAIRNGDVDMVAFGRAFLADPEFAIKAETGRADEILTCIACNQGCTGRLGLGLETSCLVNPSVGREVEYRLRPTRSRKRVVVVGGGPAGMEVARLLSERGHDTVLLEKEPELGGQATLAGLQPHRAGWRTFVRDAHARLLRSGARVELNSEATASRLADLAPTVIVCATGSTTSLPAILPEGSGRVLHATALMRSGERLNGRVAVVGGTRIGCSVAEWLADVGTEVVLIEPSPFLGGDVERGTLLALQERIASNPRIEVRLNRDIIRRSDEFVTIARTGSLATWEAENVAVNTIVYATVRRSQSALGMLVRSAQLADEIYDIGDALTPRSTLEAMFEAAELGRRI